MAENDSAKISDKFKGPRLKLTRARKHLSDIKGLIADWQASGPTKHSDFVGGVTEIYSGASLSGGITTYVAPLPEELPVILGDFVHNLRASLDHLAADLVDLNGGSKKGVYFPFSHKETELDEQIKNKKFHRAGVDAVELLKAFEPYNGGNEILRAIHDLDVEDKHQIILPNPTPQYIAFSLNIIESPSGPLLSFDPPEESDQTSLTFPTTSHLGGKPFIQTLEEMVEVTEGILEAFSVLYPSQSAAS